MESELIATLLIDKIISLAYRNHYVLKAENNLGVHCADYLINTLTTPFIEQNFLYYEYDDLDPSQVQSHSTQMFYNSSKTLLNTWIELAEPEPPTIDRDLSTLIEFTYSTTKREDEDYLNTDSNNNRTFSTKEVLSRNSISKVSIRVESTTTQNDNNNDNTNNNRRQSTRMSLIDLPSFPITLNDDDMKRNDDTPEIVALREEFEIEKMRILEERKKVEAEQEKERLIQQEKKQPKKGFNFNKVRFNINGELIAFKPIKLKDLSKDFYITRTHIKNLGKVRNDNDKRKQKEEVVIEHNPHLGDVAFPSTMTLPGSNSNSSSNRLKDKFKKDDSNIIQPAGSNYDIFIPEVGVSLTEGTSKKGGNKDFGKRYKKTSSVDFDKMLHEYIPILNKAKMKPQQLTDTNIYSPQLTSQPTRSYINIHNTNNTNNVTNSNTVISSSGGGGHNRSISLFNMSSNNPLLDGVNATTTTGPIAFPSVNPSAFNSRLYRTSDIDFDSIKLGSNYRSGLTSLKYTLEEIADLDEGNLVLPTSTIGKGSKRTFRVCNTDMKVNNNSSSNNNKHKQNDIETVNKFNAELMKKDRDNMDGSGYFPTNKSALFRKPKRGNLIKELGKNIVMTKLPRSRRFNMSKFN